MRQGGKGRGMRINAAAVFTAAMAVCSIAAVVPMLIAGRATAQAPAAAPTGSMDGAKLYQADCSACHQVDGKGIPGAFPALAGSAIVKGPDVGYLALVLNGRGGMPAFKPELDDASLAQILTYVRTAWGAQGGPITVSAVAVARGSDTPYTPPPTIQAH